MNFLRSFYHLYTIAKFRFFERTKHINGINLRYILKKRKKSNRLFVVFSGFAGPNIKARYNYYSTLKDCSSNLLFILDDFGYNSVGSYYLGDNAALYKERTIVRFVEEIKRKNNIKDIYFLGTSKGGSSALIYGLEMNADCIVVGSPQIRIGDYLSQNEYRKKILDSICDEENGIDSEWLNSIIVNLLKKKPYSNRLILIYSSEEEDYDGDLKRAVPIFTEQCSNIELYDHHYKNHFEVSKFFKEHIELID